MPLVGLPAHVSGQEGLPLRLLSPSSFWLEPATTTSTIATHTALTMPALASTTSKNNPALAPPPPSPAASPPSPANPQLTPELDTLAKARCTFPADVDGAERSLVQAACFECTDAQRDPTEASHRVALCQQALEAVKLEADCVPAVEETADVNPLVRDEPAGPEQEDRNSEDGPKA
ncbi:hypothetical protein ACQY0O_008152 [Thecaphora frezii]